MVASEWTPLCVAHICIFVMITLVISIFMVCSHEELLAVEDGIYSGMWMQQLTRADDDDNHASNDAVAQ
jgi:hypothetical protein